MADDQQQDQEQEQEQDEQQGDQRQDGDQGKSDDARGDEDKPGAALLKALNEERDARRKAEAALRKREQAERQAETDRAIKAGEWESVAKAKDTEIADLNARIADLEGQIAGAQLETVRAKVGAKYRLPEHWTVRLRGMTEAELDADARVVAKDLAPPRAADTEMGKGNGGGNGKTSDQEAVEALRKTGRYASIG